MRKQSANLKKPNLPTYMPKINPERKHALPQNCFDTIHNLSHIVVFLWMKSGSGFWYYISYSTESQLVGYVWNGNCWTERAIKLTSVRAYY